MEIGYVLIEYVFEVMEIWGCDFVIGFLKIIMF